MVRAKLSFTPNSAVTTQAPLSLDGEQLELVSISIDGQVLASDTYLCTDEGLTLLHPPSSSFELTTVVRIKPQNNTELSGLYKSSGNFCSQCEAEGFRRITYYLDRPDVMSRFSVTIIADKQKYPVLLSNGNRAAYGENGNQHWVRWDDPFLKPSYLFALVAGNLACHSGTFTTQSGREVRLEIWVEPQNIDKCEHALQSLKDSMRWDEETFGLEYDLDIYMIVAVSDFNMGAMENKGLNVFNTKYVLCRPDTATDVDYEHIQGVIGHEYFHNWTGNRVTCRDWFQLTLKEGLTVYRDQRFTADMTSPTVKRIEDVLLLRTGQFDEDAGPMAHPIRPESYIEMNNFYTVTVYNKGAEVIRVYETLLGIEGFRKGMDLYFERHDGQAVTCDDFRAAMADANGIDLSQFELWYSQPGTPTLEAEGHYDSAAQTYQLTLRQSRAAMKGYPAYLPMLIPVQCGLIGEHGDDLPLQLHDEAQPQGTNRVLQLCQQEQQWTFQNVSSKPVPSLLRGFSAPVTLQIERSSDELAFLMAHDSDEFNRWDATQIVMQTVILDLVDAIKAGQSLELPNGFLDSFAQLLDDQQLDGSMKALLLTIPSERLLAQQAQPVQVEALHQAREIVLSTLANRFADQWLAIYQAGQSDAPYSNDQTAINQRRLKNCALEYLCYRDTENADFEALQQFAQADNMTDMQASLEALLRSNSPSAEQPLQQFYQQWQNDPLVVDKWFVLQAKTSNLEKIVELSKHDAFTLQNPNRARSLLGAFWQDNILHFHRADGAGYEFIGDHILALDQSNPQLASRIAGAFNAWRRFDDKRQALIKAQLQRIAQKDGLSKDVYEIVSRSLEG